MFHVNDKGDAKPCRAKQPSNCKFYQGEDDTRHYETVSEATEATEKRLEKEFGTQEKKEVRYSFVKEFRKQEQQFNKDFEGIPNRFFNADLRGKFVRENADEISMNLGEHRRIDIHRLGVRMITALSSPSDNGMNNEEVIKLLEAQGFENIEEVNKLSSFDNKAQRGWKAQLEDKDVVIIDSNVGTTINGYSFRYGTEDFERGKPWTKVDIRKIAGNARAEKKTGVNVFKTIIRTESTKEAEQEYRENIQKMREELDNDTKIPEEVKQELMKNLERSEYKRGQIVKSLIKLEDSQLEGKNFIAQKKYIKEHSGKVATVWEDKKDTDDVRKDLVKNSTVKDLFRKIDLDNDVDPVEYKKFEDDINEVRSKMPSIPKGMEPELRLRKLGKHSSSSFTISGLYNPAKNSLGISVNDSSSYVHEMMHCLDLNVKKNASLSNEFREISKEYSKNLKLPDGVSSSKAEYYNVATEQLARFGEVWASERLGIDNRLINKEKFKDFDYAPIMENPRLKEKAFKFFDKLFENDMK